MGPEKAAQNKEKHGVSFEDAVGIFSGPVLTERSDRKGKSDGSPWGG